MIEGLEILGGLVLLFYGGDTLVDGSVSLARRLHVPKAIIGLTIVAFGTSAPEFVVNIEAALKNLDDIAIGNIVGSNISNTLLILGVSGMFAVIKLTNKQVRKDLIFLTIITIMFLAVSYYQQKVGFIDGLVYLTLLLAYSIKKYQWVRKNKDVQQLDIDHDFKAFKAVSFIVLGIIMLILGGNLTVMGAVGIAQQLGISEAVISVTIIAIGSSAPELSACVSACKKGHSEIAIANVIGSNIFNIILGLGAISVFKDINISEKFLNFDMFFLAFSICALLFATIFSGKISRTLAVFFVLIYITFLSLQYIHA